MSGGALRHVLWIGGPPGGGKTSVALRLARRYGLRWYGADTRTWQHRDRALAAGHPAARRFEAMTPRQRWEQATPEQMLAMSLHADRGQMVIDDLAALPEAPLVVAEGSTLPAYALSAGIADRDRAVWLLPTREFQDAALGARRMLPGQVALYRLIGETVAGEAREHGARVVTVDGALDIDATADVVAWMFAAALAAGPVAGTLAERRALLREANGSIVAQVRGYFARPWARGRAETSVQEFLCECADPACTANVRLPVAALPADAVLLAPGHR